jgi:hypothetical protein
LGLRGDEPDAGRLPAYSEQVIAWLGPEAAAADAEHRLGQDLLLTSRPEDWKAAADKLEEAKKQYDRVQARAATLRRALLLRDELLAALPYYTQWVARQRPADANERRTFEQGPLAKVEELWRRLNELDALLRLPDVQKLDELDVPPTPRLRTLDEKWKEFQREYDEARGGNFPSAQKPWNRLEALLAVPFLPPADREQLLKKSRQISKTLNAETERSEKVEPISEEAQAEVSRERAWVQGRLALASLGREAFDAVKGTYEFARVQDRVESARGKESSQAVLEAGDEFGRRWNQLVKAAGDRVELSRKKGLDEAAVLLRDAVRLARRLDGAAAPPWPRSTRWPSGAACRCMICSATRLTAPSWTSGPPTTRAPARPTTRPWGWRTPTTPATSWAAPRAPTGTRTPGWRWSGSARPS